MQRQNNMNGSWHCREAAVVVCQVWWYPTCLAITQAFSEHEPWPSARLLGPVGEVSRGQRPVGLPVLCWAGQGCAVSPGLAEGCRFLLSSLLDLKGMAQVGRAVLQEGGCTSHFPATLGVLWKGTWRDARDITHHVHSTSPGENLACGPT